MKTTLIAALMLAAFPAMAQDETWNEASPEVRLILCNSVSEISSTIMQQRQAGRPMADMMQIAGKSELAHLVQPIIIDAYEINRYQTAEVQREEVEDFRDKWYLTCVKAARE